MSSAVSSVVGAFSSRKESKANKAAMDSASNLQMKATKKQLAFMRFALKQQRGDLLGAVDAGEIDIETAFNQALQELTPLTDLGALDQAIETLKDPSKVFEMPGVQFQLEQGQASLENLLSKASGGGVSGRALNAAQEFGQNFAASKLDQALNRLLPFANIEVGARQNVANLFTGKGQALANLRIAGAGGAAAATGAATPGISTAIGQQGTIQAQNVIGTAAQRANAMNQINQLAGQSFNFNEISSLFSGNQGFLPGNSGTATPSSTKQTTILHA